MELSWSGFFLEVINFIVLVWLLKRLFYKPVQRAIEERRQAIQKTLDDANHVQRAAESLQKTYDDRVREWEREKETQRAALSREIGEERKRRLLTLETELSEEKARNRAVEEAQRQDVLHKAESRALLNATAFASRLLRELSGPELEAHIIAFFTRAQSEGRAEIPSRSAANGRAEVRTAFALSKEQKDAISRAVTSLRKEPVSCRFSEDPTLLAGLHIQMGSFVLQANLRDELNYFVSVGQNGN